MLRALVCAYSEVGYRCLRVLLDSGVEVPLVFTHADAPDEQRWFASVAELARARAVAVCTEDPHAPPWPGRIAALAPHYLFCFYYRALLGPGLLASARWGALNMHGSLLPRYRGRAPVNWAILQGESQTGATLHYMVQRPDAGAIVAQEAVPIGIDDTALDVSLAVAGAAARLLGRCLPQLAAGPPAATPMDLEHGSYFGGRRPEDGRIDFTWPALRVHNLIRAVAPPFPGAFAELGGGTRLRFASSRWRGEPARHAALAPCLYAERGTLFLDCRDGVRLELTGASLGGEWLDAARLERLSAAPLCLDPSVLQGNSDDEEVADSRG